MTENRQADPLFRLMESIECHECLDTNIAITLYGPANCANCAGKRRAWSEPAEQLQRCVSIRLEKQPPLPVEKEPLALARALTHFTVDAPLTLNQIVEYYRVDIRKAKALIALLRDDWILPIGSLREPPYGSYWIKTGEQFLKWARAYRSQAISQLVTIHRLQRQWYPHLYGQQDFDFLALINDEIREAL